MNFNREYIYLDVCLFSSVLKVRISFGIETQCIGKNLFDL